MKITGKLILTTGLLAIGGCAYPGGSGQFVKTYGTGPYRTVRFDDDMSAKLLTFNLAPRDEKFAQSVKAGDVALAAKYVSPSNVNKFINNAPPIAYAAATGNGAMVEMLVANGSRLTFRQGRENALPTLAAAFGHTTLANKLVRMGAGSNADVAYGMEVYAKSQARNRHNQQMAEAGRAKLFEFFGRAMFNSVTSPPQDRDSGFVSENQRDAWAAENGE